jgi:cation:H+ antiporter
MLVSCLIIWRSATGFEIASDYLGRKLSHGVKGATINAIASSMPEFLSSFFFLFYLRDVNGFSGGLGITAGSSIFNLLVIPVTVTLVILFRDPSKTIELTRKVLRRDGIVLIITILILVLIIDRQSLKPIHGLVLVMAYMVYLAYMFFSMKSMKNSMHEKPIPEHYPSQQPLSVKILTLKLECLIVGKKVLNSRNAWGLLVISTLVMSLGTWLLVLGTKWLSDGLHIPILFVAVVLSAAASSVPDTVISVKDAKKGNYDDAISNALGSNIFDISFALGLPLFVYTLMYGSIEMEPVVVELSTELWMFLLITTILGAILFNIGRKLTLWKACLFILIYLIFVLYVVGHAFQMPLTEVVSDALMGFVDWLKNLF